MRLVKNLVKSLVWVALTAALLGLSVLVAKDFIQAPTKSVGATDFTVIDLSMSRQPNKTSYLQGEALDVTGAAIDVTFDDGSMETVYVSDDMVSGYDPNLIGSQSINVTYGDLTTMFNVVVIERKVVSVKMAQLPSTTHYIQGQALDLTGAQIAVTDSNGAVQIVDVAINMVSGYDSSQVGVKLVFVTYSGLSTSFEVTVDSDSTTGAAELVPTVFMKAMPLTTNYVQGEELDLTGAQIEVVEPDGSMEIKDVSPEMVSGFDSNEVGTQSVKVTHRSSSTAFDVTVVAKPAAPTKVKVVRTSPTSARVVWEGKPGTTGYVVLTNGNFSAKKLNTSSVELSQLTKNQTYEIKVCAYVLVGKEKVFSKSSDCIILNKK